MRAEDLEHMEPVKTGFDKWWDKHGGLMQELVPDVNIEGACRVAYLAGKCDSTKSVLDGLRGES